MADGAMVLVANMASIFLQIDCFFLTYALIGLIARKNDKQQSETFRLECESVELSLKPDVVKVSTSTTNVRQFRVECS